MFEIQFVLRGFLLFISPSCSYCIKNRKVDWSSSPQSPQKLVKLPQDYFGPESFRSNKGCGKWQLEFTGRKSRTKAKHLGWSGEKKVTLLINKSEVVWLLSRPEIIWIFYRCDKCNFLLYIMCWNGPGSCKVRSAVSYRYDPSSAFVGSKTSYLQY